MPHSRAQPRAVGRPGAEFHLGIEINLKLALFYSFFKNVFCETISDFLKGLVDFMHDVYKDWETIFKLSP